MLKLKKHELSAADLHPSKRHTSATKHANNNPKPIPNQYRILFKK